LSLTNIPERLLDATLDTLSRALGANGCWVQFISPGSGKLTLSAYHGFSPHIHEKIAAMDLAHPLAQEVIGIGSSVTISDLTQNGHLGLSMFAEEGFVTLVAVPIFTYRVHGITGVVYRRKKRFTKDDTRLITTAASIIGLTLNKYLSLKHMDDESRSRETEKLPASTVFVEEKKVEPFSLPKLETITEDKQLETVHHNNGNGYKEHVHKMNNFRNSHRALY
jgi:hypothetical protein